MRPLAASYRAALSAAGATVEVIRDHVTFARLVATIQNETIEIDLAVDSPRLVPVRTIDGIPTLSVEDLVARKVLAVLDRTEGRDFVDLWALSVRIGRHQSLTWAQQLDSCASVDDVANAFGRLKLVDDHELPCGAGDREAVRTWFKEWGAELRAGRA